VSGGNAVRSFALSSFAFVFLLSALACNSPGRVGTTDPPPPVKVDDAMSRTELEEDARVARAVKEVVIEYCRRGRGGKAVAAKEAVAAMASVVGERCVDAAGEIPVRGHDLVPGQRMFSDEINVLLTGDTGDESIAAMPARSVFGTLREQLAGSRFGREHFPRLGEVFAGFAGRIGAPEDWGKVPLSLPAEYWPEKLPLRVAFDTRPGVDAAVLSIKDDKRRVLRACALAMALTLKDETLAEQLDPAAALTLTFEMINGMAKTAPMTDKAIDSPTREMREAQHQVVRIQPR
jgi:hypothetical protein